MTAFSLKDLEDHTKLVGEFVLEQIKLAVAPLKARVFELETRIAELEKRGVEYKGIYQRACAYRRGDVVTADGSMFVAIADVVPGEAPGHAGNWQLAVKSSQPPRQPTKPRTMHANNGA